MTKDTVRVRALKMINGVEHVLLVKEKPQEKLKHDGERFIKRGGIGLPGGRVNNSSSLIHPDNLLDYLRDEARRELEEETGLITELANFSRFPKVYPKDEGRNVYLFEVSNLRGELQPKETEFIEKAEWVPRWQAFGDYGSHEKPVTCEHTGKTYFPALYRSHEDMVHVPSWGDTDPQESIEELPA